jgi:hypothetical protein
MKVINSVLRNLHDKLAVMVDRKINEKKMAESNEGDCVVM